MDLLVTPKFMEYYGSFALVRIAVLHTDVLEYVCYAVSGSVYVETAPLTTVDGAFSGAPCKLNSWVTHKFVGNKSIFSSSEQTKHFNHPMF